MSHQSNKKEIPSTDRENPARWTKRNGLTLLELLIAIGVMSMVMAALAALSSAVESVAEYGEGYGNITHQARVVLDRISRTVQEASTSNEFPGAIVLSRTVNTSHFPETLVVWHPPGTPADPEGLPRYSELVIFSPAPDKPNELLEITVPNDNRKVPDATNTASWLSSIDAIKQSDSSHKTTLTTLLRTASPNATTILGAVRFNCRLSPSDTECAAFEAGTLAWDQLSWAQGIFGQHTGMRQLWVGIEIQMIPMVMSGQSDGPYMITFLGSAALYHEMHK